MPPQFKLQAYDTCSGQSFNVFFPVSPFGFNKPHVDPIYLYLFNFKLECISSAQIGDQRKTTTNLIYMTKVLCSWFQPFLVMREHKNHQRRTKSFAFSLILLIATLENRRTLYWKRTITKYCENHDSHHGPFGDHGNKYGLHISSFSCYIHVEPKASILSYLRLNGTNHAEMVSDANRQF
jgi:hypothetical protein